MERMFAEQLEELVQIMGTYRADNTLRGMLMLKPDYYDLMKMIEEVLKVERDKKITEYHKDCTIEVYREGHTAYYSVFTNDGFEIASGFTSDESPTYELAEGYKNVVDDFVLNPKDYGYEE